MIDLYMDVKKAVIEEVVIISDALNFELIDILKNTLTAIKYNKNDIKAKLNGLEQAQPDLAPQVDDFMVSLVGEMEG